MRERSRDKTDGKKGRERVEKVERKIYRRREGQKKRENSEEKEKE